jgi:histidyl-tRNA synthetase
MARPQKGRLRQFHQIGVESLGDPHPLCDVFQIALAYQLLSEWGLQNTTVFLDFWIFFFFFFFFF